MHIVTLTTCHNRRNSTLKVLDDLYEQKLPVGVVLSHVIVDDGSTDGTAEAVHHRFPDVEIVAGNGHLYWAGGMRHGWEHSVASKEFDYLFVYNDDVRLFKTAINDLLEACKSLPGQDNIYVMAGSFRNYDNGHTTYGGRRRSSAWHPLKFAQLVEPDGTLQRADTLNMNGALISRGALRKIGFLADYFVHSAADFEYGLRMVNSGGSVYVAGKHIGTCEPNRTMDLPDEISVTLGQRLQLLADIKREPFGQRLKFYKQHGGLLWPVLFVSPYITVWLRHLWFIFVRLMREGKAKCHE